MAGILENSEETGFTLSTAHLYRNYSGRDFSSSWIIIYNQSTVKIFNNTHILTDVKTNRMTVKCNTGVKKSSSIGKLKGFLGEVWYHTNRITNTPSMDKAENYFPVKYGR